MPAQMDQWEQIFKREGYVFPEPAPLVISFAALLKERGAKSILDIGCGTGRHIVHMIKRGFYATGLDNAPTALRLAQKWLQEEQLEADLILSDMCQPLPFENESFDAVLSTQVIHHALLATVIGTAREIQRIVRPGGYIFISVPARKAIEADSPAPNEIEPNTFIPTSGSEKGLPHHLFAPDELRGIFPQFETLDLRVIDDQIMALTALKKSRT
jgi:SAM-dependent methyltransferase